MRKMLRIELTSREDISAELDLPAGPYKLLDTLEKLRLEEGETPRWELLQSHDALHLFQILNQDDGSLAEVNALAQRLAGLDERGLAILGGLADMERRELGQPFPLSRLIDLAYSTDCCHLVEGVVTDAQLGRFCAESGFVPGADDLNDDMFELLNFEQIGRQFREAEDGVFTQQGYVQKHDALRQVYGTLDLALKQPDYIIRAELANGTQVDLPLEVGAAVPDEPAQCVDCPVPALNGQTAMLSTMDALARRIAELEVDGELPKYKAVLEAVRCEDIAHALTLADALDRYTFSPKLLEPEDVAVECLETMLSKDDAGLLQPYVDLQRYGQRVVEQDGGKLTCYGLVERADDGPIQTMAQQSGHQEMEMM